MSDESKPGKEVAASNPQVPTSERDWTPYHIIGALIAVVLIAALVGS